jgi:hypothetical protein
MPIVDRVVSVMVCSIALSDVENPRGWNLECFEISNSSVEVRPIRLISTDAFGRDDYVKHKIELAA